MPDRVKLSFIVFDSRGHSGAQPWAWEVPGCQNYKWRLNPVWTSLAACHKRCG